MISIVATIGLFLDIIGVVILYFNGPPLFTLLPDGSELVCYTENAEEANKKANIAKRKILISKFALLIIIFGFVLQLVGQFTYKEYHQADRSNYTNNAKNKIKALEPNTPFEEI